MRPEIETTEARRPRAKPSREIEAGLFRTLNRLVEPSVRKGWGSPRFAPGSLVVLETTGLRTGRRSRVPLAALRVGEHVVVGTFRGRRSQWVKNLGAQPSVRYWIGGRPRSAFARVIPPGRPPRSLKDWPPAACGLLPLLSPYTRAGWAFAILTPAAAPPRRS